MEINCNTIDFIIKIGVIITLIVGLLSIDAYLDKKIERTINSSDYLDKVANRVRPSIIFSSDNIILHDLGGMKYIEKIEIPEVSDFFPNKIIIFPSVHLERFPLLSSVDSIYFTYDVKRVGNKQIEYTLQRSGWVSTLNAPCRFRLEVLP